MGSTSTGETAQKTEKQPLNSSSFSLLQIDLFKSDLPHVTDRQTAKFLTASHSGLLPGLLLAQRTAPSSLNAKQFGFPLPEPCLATFTSQIKIKSLISIYIVCGSRADRFPRGSVAWRWLKGPSRPPAASLGWAPPAAAERWRGDKCPHNAGRGGTAASHSSGI